ncbi:predicted protein [Sclerotinia sclerotiorum 1980 UF-70]|uniref:Uncharacterized protein n=1 Tax=Sclerotinia sclerotiorum (strain ATCC 18683 / 1980 / Ss-1) TaxID=665079 RepID=A7EVF7_SCLS1|nr:predicted protein [Sclerotinia sclerotiorum 1980 UF-70]EDN93449.1 predicted protein [Sclerotinia sclerotiorum 1980 UF-70]
MLCHHVNVVYSIFKIDMVRLHMLQIGENPTRNPPLHRELTNLFTRNQTYHQDSLAEEYRCIMKGIFGTLMKPLHDVSPGIH